MNNDGLFHLVGLAGAIAGGKSNAGNRKDDKICTAQSGECRSNSRYYSPGMKDAKSWSMPCADDTCTEGCPHLSDRPAEQRPEEERREAAFGFVNSFAQQQRAKQMRAANLLRQHSITDNTDEVLD
jgi:hypothetical protein